MPISAPRPNCAPSVKAVDTLVYTHAASTILVNKAARSLFSVTIHSLCLELFSCICPSASSKAFHRFDSHLIIQKLCSEGFPGWQVAAIQPDNVLPVPDKPVYLHR